MQDTVRRALWNRAVALVFGLPAVGYLAFLSQFALGERGVVADALGGLTVFALPVMFLYSAVLDVVGPVDQTLGTAGFFVFAYLLAVVVVLVVRRGVQFVRGRSPPEDGTEPTNS